MFCSVSKQPNLFTFFTQPKAAPVPSLIFHSTLVHSKKSALGVQAAPEAAIITKQKASKVQPEPAEALVTKYFLEKFLGLIKNNLNKQLSIYVFHWCNGSILLTLSASTIFNVYRYT